MTEKPEHNQIENDSSLMDTHGSSSTNGEVSSAPVWNTASSSASSLSAAAGSCGSGGAGSSGGCGGSSKKTGSSGGGTSGSSGGGDSSAVLACAGDAVDALDPGPMRRSGSLFQRERGQRRPLCTASPGGKPGMPPPAPAAAAFATGRPCPPC